MTALRTAAAGRADDGWSTILADRLLNRHRRARREKDERTLPGLVSALVARLNHDALRRRDPELAELVLLASQPLDLDDTTSTAPRTEEELGPDDGLPIGWPDGWPRPGDEPGDVTVTIAHKRPWETQGEWQRRLEEERAKQRGATVSASGGRIRVTESPAAVQAALAGLDRLNGYEFASLIAAGSPLRRDPPVIARPYQPIGAFTVDVAKRTVVDRRGRPVEGVRVAANGTLVAAAPPPSEHSTAFAELAAAVRTLAAKPTPDVHVHVASPPAPVVHFHVPEQAAPHVDVHVPPAAARSVRVEYDADGNKRYVSEDA